jgi:hypothetical protein
VRGISGIEILKFLHETMALDPFIVDIDRLLTADDLAIFSVAKEKIVQHLSVRILSHLVLLNQE